MSSDMRRILLVTAICAVIVGGVLLLAWSGNAAPARAAGRPVRLMAFAGAGIQPPLDELGAAFQKKTGTRVEFSYKGSGCLLPDIVVGQKGDLYIPGEQFYMQQAIERKMVAQYKPVAKMKTVIICQAGNPKKIKSIKDLGRPGLRIGLGDAKAIAIGRAARTTLDKAKCRQAVEKNVVMNCMNVVELGNAVKLRQLDAAIVWDGTAALYKGGVQVIAIPADCWVVSTIPVGVLKSSAHPKEAARFMEFLASKEAAPVFAKHGYSPVSAGATQAKS